MGKLFYIFFGFGWYLLSSCNEKKETRPLPSYLEVKEPLQKSNAYWYREEILNIEAFIQRRNWNMQPTGTGIYIEIYEPADTSQQRILEGQIARVNYTVSVIDSTLIPCYSSDGIPEDFMVGLDNVESGLHEAILYLRKGDKARIVLPYWRAFGLIGDQDKIPPQSSLVYDIELMEIIDTDNRKRVQEQKQNREKRAEAYKKLREQQH